MLKSLDGALNFQRIGVNLGPNALSNLLRSLLGVDSGLDGEFNESLLDSGGDGIITLTDVNEGVIGIFLMDTSLGDGSETVLRVDCVPDQIVEGLEGVGGSGDGVGGFSENVVSDSPDFKFHSSSGGFEGVDEFIRFVFLGNSGQNFSLNYLVFKVLQINQVEDFQFIVAREFSEYF